MTYFTTQVPNIASEVFDGEVVVADFVSGTYFSLAGSGAAVWQGLAAGRSVDDVAAWISELCGAPLADVTTAVEELIGALQQANLIAPLDAAPAQAPLPHLAAAAFEAPRLEAFTDLADLLLLDPVHDVTEAGWPHLPPTTEA